MAVNKTRMSALGCLVLVLLAGAGLWFITQPLVTTLSPTAALMKADADRLRADVAVLCGLAPRDFSHPGNLDRAARHIRAELARCGAEVREQVYRVEGREYRNVVARFGAPSGAGGRIVHIVVGAHYDACEEFPGADDNASGVAGLLELGRIFGARPSRLPLELVAFTLEEPPYFRSAEMGSAVHARGLAASEARARTMLSLDRTRLRAMLSLEMIGCFADDLGSQTYPAPGLGLLYPSRGDFIAVVGRFADWKLVRQVKGAMRAASALPVRSINAPAAVPGIDFSDQLNYWAAGYPAVMITDTAFFRNPRYHTAEDTPETLDYDRMASVVDGVAQAVAALDGDD